MDGGQNPIYEEDDCKSVVTDVGDDEVDSGDSAEAAAAAFLEEEDDYLVDYSNWFFTVDEEGPVIDDPIDTEGFDGHFLELNDLDCPL